jgi:hypothetical protein
MASAVNLRKATTMKVFTPKLPQTTAQMFTPSQTDMQDMVRRAMAAFDASRAADRFEAACAANRRRARGDHDAYCNQMPRARGFRT